MHRSLGARLRSWFFAGLVLFGPLAVTLYVAWWFVDTVDNWVRPLVPASFWPDTFLPFDVPGFGVAIVLVGLTVLGFIAANVAGRTLVGLGEAMLDRTPVLRGLYKSIKQIFETVFSQSGTHFRRVGLVEYPDQGRLVDRVPVDRAAAAGRRRAAAGAVHVRVPALHAESDDRLLFLRSDRAIIELPITPDEAAKLVMSAGLIQPDGAAALAAMASDARLAARLPRAPTTSLRTAAPRAAGNARGSCYQRLDLNSATRIERASAFVHPDPLRNGNLLWRNCRNSISPTSSAACRARTPH